MKLHTDTETAPNVGERKKHLCKNAKTMKPKEQTPSGNDEAKGIPSLGREMTSFSKHDVIWRRSSVTGLHHDVNGQG